MNVREPIKKTSIKKKKTIIEKGFLLMCEKGYHNVTCVDIAKYAGVSTGIIYQYFKDKRDIFIHGVEDYTDKIMFPMIDIIDNVIIDKTSLNLLLSKMIDKFISVHNIKKEAHEELMAMSHLDPEISDIFKSRELLMTEKISTILLNNGFNEYHINEKVHIIIGLVDNYCHEVVYHKHHDLNYNVMKEEIINIIVKILA